MGDAGERDPIDDPEFEIPWPDDESASGQDDDLLGIPARRRPRFGSGRARRPRRREGETGDVDLVAALRDEPSVDAGSPAESAAPKRAKTQPVAEAPEPDRAGTGPVVEAPEPEAPESEPPDPTPETATVADGRPPRRRTAKRAAARPPTVAPTAAVHPDGPAPSPAPDTALLTERLEALRVEVRSLGQVTDALRRDVRKRPAVVDGSSAERLDEVAGEILEAISGNEAIGRSLQELGRALSLEVAEVGQATSDIIGAHIDEEVGRLRDEFANGSSREDDRWRKRLESLATATDDTVTRVEVLAEALVESLDRSPDDRERGTIEGLEGLSLTLGARFEATTQTATIRLGEAIDLALSTATDRLRELTPQPVDRSLVAALTRIEDRLASLTLQQQQQEESSSAGLAEIETTMARLAAAQADDLERLLDALETRGRATTETEPGPAVDTGPLLAAVEELQDLPTEVGELRTEFAQSLQDVHAQLTQLRRRLAVRPRTDRALSEDEMERLADLIAARLGPPAGVRSKPRPR